MMARENPMFSTTLSRALHLKAVRLGGSSALPLSSSSSVPLSDLELHTVGDGCDLNAPAMAALTASLSAP